MFNFEDLAKCKRFSALISYFRARDNSLGPIFVVAGELFICSYQPFVFFRVNHYFFLSIGFETNILRF
jgi:hypothetical protein